MDNPVANPMQMLQALKNNPVQFLLQRRMNIPANIANDPNAIIQHLLSTNQISQSAVNNAYQIMNSMKNKQ